MLNDNEKILVGIINEAKRFVEGELELDCVGDEWYAMDYREELGGVFPINMEKYNSPVITDEEVRTFDIDIVKCFNECHVAYAG